MPNAEPTFQRLSTIPNLTVVRDALLSRYTRFGIGGPARIFAHTASVEAFIGALSIARLSGVEWVVIGGGTNLIVSDRGFPGVVLKFTGDRLLAAGNRVVADAGASLQALVDFTTARGLKGLETLAGIPGSVGAAVYGNAGAYGHSISERVHKVRFFDGSQVRVFPNEECQFHYRESLFKEHKEWIIFSTELLLEAADAAELSRISADIVRVRNEKFPPTMKCAGSIFKNLLMDELPEPVRVQVPQAVVREGKVPAAWFLEQVGAKGMANGGIHVATYHANLIYNEGDGTASQLVHLIQDLKQRVQSRFGLDIEEEVQYVGDFNPAAPVSLDSIRRQVQAMPHILQSMLSSLSEEEGAWKPAPDRWSIVEVLGHLWHLEPVFRERIERMLREDNPVLANYDPDVHSAAGAYRRAGLAAAVLEFSRERETSLAVLESITPEQLSRAGVHSELGPITVESLLHEWPFHDLGHVRQIAELVRAVKYFPRMGAWRKYYTIKP